MPVHKVKCKNYPKSHDTQIRPNTVIQQPFHIFYWHLHYSVFGVRYPCNTKHGIKVSYLISTIIHQQSICIYKVIQSQS